MCLSPRFVCRLPVKFPQNPAVAPIHIGRMRQQAPRAAGPRGVEDSVEDGTHTVLAGASACRGWREEGRGGTNAHSASERSERSPRVVCVLMPRGISKTAAYPIFQTVSQPRCVWLLA